MNTEHTALARIRSTVEILYFFMVLQSYHAPKEHMKAIYTATIRYTLDYGAMVWNLTK